MEKKYWVSLPFSGSLNVKVVAENEEQALQLGMQKIDNMTVEEVIESIEYENYDVLEE